MLPARRGKKRRYSLAISEKYPIFARECIAIKIKSMATTVVRRPASFRLRADLLDGLKRKAAQENRTLNNYVESVLLDIVYDEPNEETKAAIAEAMSRKEYPEEELYGSAEEMFNALQKAR